MRVRLALIVSLLAAASLTAQQAAPPEAARLHPHGDEGDPIGAQAMAGNSLQRIEELIEGDIADQADGHQANTRIIGIGVHHRLRRQP